MILSDHALTDYSCSSMFNRSKRTVEIMEPDDFFDYLKKNNIDEQHINKMQEEKVSIVIIVLVTVGCAGHCWLI